MNGHYFSDVPAVPSSTGRVPLHLADLAIELEVDRGVFSGTRVDPGTRVLLQEAAQPGTARTILDLGCGYGPIACALAIRGPGAAVWAVDVNARARQLCEANAARLGLTSLIVAEPSAVPADLRFDLIVSNPPIRIGKAALHAMLTDWLGRLADGGRAELVVQKNLGSDSLARWLNERGWSTTRLLSRAGYRVLSVQAKRIDGSTPP